MRVGLPLALLLLARAAAGEHPHPVDLLELTTDPDRLVRVHGSAGDGGRGVPVAGGFDTNGDGHPDFAMAAMQASALIGGATRTLAGEVYLVFGDGSGGGSYDTAIPSADILEIAGVVTREASGSELWMDDVTGDGLGDLLIARQNYTPDAGRIGAGALTILVGGPELTAHAATLEPLDLGAAGYGPRLVTFVGATQLSRLGIWMRTGDVTGDGIADIVVGADQTSELGQTHRGAVWVIQGGPHLAVSQTFDLADFDGVTILPGKIARITPPSPAGHLHFGATCQIADLDGDGRAEVLIGGTLNRAGAGLRAEGAPVGSAHGSGGSLDGTLYIAWGDNFALPWPYRFEFELTSGPGSYTRIDGAPCNRSFGEEILGGLDYDDDGESDLFVGDIVGNCAPGVSRPQAGSGHVFYSAAELAGLDFDLGAPPPGIAMTHFWGGAAGDIAADTALHGDFDGDGVADLAFSSPHASPFGRSSAGALHVFFGEQERWPAEIDLKPGSLPVSVRIAEVYGAHGTNGSDAGDTLAYSAAAGDVNGDGRTDLITNEMLGNGVLAAAEDDGNLIVLSGSLLVPGPPAVPGVSPWAFGALAALLAIGCRLAGWPKRRARPCARPDRAGR